MDQEAIIDAAKDAFYKMNLSIMTLLPGMKRTSLLKWTSENTNGLGMCALNNISSSPANKVPNWGVRCGLAPGCKAPVFVLDLDTYKIKDALQWEVVEKFKGLKTMLVETPTGGYHVYFKFDERMKELKLEKSIEMFGYMDVRSTGTMVVGWNSVLTDPSVLAAYEKKGVVMKHCDYQLIKTYSPMEMPEWVFELIQKNLPRNKKEALCDAQPEKPVEYDLLRKCVMGLYVERAKSYDSWLLVLVIIGNVSVMNNYRNKGLLLAHKFSEQCSEKYDENVVTKTFEKIFDSYSEYGNKKAKMGSLVKMLKHDNHELYTELFGVNSKLFNIERIEKDVAIIRKYIHVQKNAKCDAKEKDVIHCILEMDPFGVYSNILSDGVALFQRRAPNIYEPLNGIRELSLWGDDIDQLYMPWFRKNCKDAEAVSGMEFVNRKINSVTFSQNEFRVILLNHKRVFREGVDKLWNTMQGVIPFRNGLYDVKLQKLVDVEEGYKPFSICVPFEWTGVIQYDEETESQFSTFFEQIFPDETVRNYVLGAFAYNLAGRPLKKAFFHYGRRGDNGKSSLFNLLRETLGQCYRSIKPEFIYTNMFASSSGHNNQMIDIIGGRVAVIPEVKGDGKRTIDNALLKMLTGADPLKGRSAYSKDDVEFTFYGGVHMFMNSLPSIDEFDGGTENRVVVIPYESLFTSSPNKARKNEFKKIDNMAEVQDNIKKVLIRELVLRASMPMPTELPKIIQNATKSYLDEINPFGSVMSQLIECNEDDAFVTLSTLMSLYKLEGKKDMKRSSFQTLIEKKLGPMHPAYYYRDKESGKQHKVRSAWPYWALNENGGEETDDEVVS